MTDTSTGQSIGPGVRTRLWRDGRWVNDDFDLTELDAHLRDDRELTWVDLLDPSEELLTELATELGLAPQAVGNALSTYDRPKATRHSTHLFVTVYATRIDVEEPKTHDSRLVLSKVSAFVMPRGLITVRFSGAEGQPPFDMAPVIERWDDNADLIQGAGIEAVGALLHGLLDEIVDGHFRTIQHMDDAIESLEALLFDDAIRTRQVQAATYRLRKELVELRRVVLPMREVVNGVLRHRTHQQQDLTVLEAARSRSLEAWYEDLYDHVLRAAEWTESLRDMVSSLFETNLSLQDAHLNTVMKKLAGWGAIIAVPTAVTGWFGQNVPYPGFSTEFGFYQSVALVLGGSGALYIAFKKRDWL